MFDPGWYGGERVDLFGGIEIAGLQFGLGHTKLAIEAGFAFYQNLNGPQIGENVGKTHLLRALTGLPADKAYYI